MSKLTIEENFEKISQIYFIYRRSNYSTKIELHGLFRECSKYFHEIYKWCSDVNDVIVNWQFVVKQNYLTFSTGRLFYRKMVADVAMLLQMLCLFNLNWFFTASHISLNSVFIYVFTLILWLLFSKQKWSIIFDY